MNSSQILVAFDGSPGSAAVLPYTVAVAERLGCSLRLLAVVKPEPRGLTPRSERVADELEARRQAALRRDLANVKANLPMAADRVETAVVLGDPVESLLAEAGRDAVSLVALTTHGRRGADRWLLGSVADKLVRLSPRPVLVVRPPYFPVPQHRVALDRLLVPLDGSPLAETALPLAQRLAGSDATLLLVWVEPWRTEGVAPLGSVPEFSALEAEAAHEAETYLAGVAGRLTQHAAVQTMVLRGRPAETLVDFAFHERIDLAVMTTHGRGGVRRLVLGSTADHVVRSGVPTLLVRTGMGNDG